MKPKFSQNNTPSLCALALVTFVIATSSAHAAVLYWDGTDTTANADGGSGIWDLTTTNWDTLASGGTDIAWPNAGNANIANFGGTGGTVTLGTSMGSAGPYPNAINVTAGNYIFDLNNLSLSSRGTNLTISSGATLVIQNGTYELQTNYNFSVTGTNALTVSAKITGAFNLQKGGGGDVTLTNDTSDFTGKLTGANGGTVSFSSIKNSGVASAAGAGSILETGYNNSMAYTGAGDSTNRTFAVLGNGNDALKNIGSGALVWTGAFSNTKAAASTLTFGGTNALANEFQGALINSTAGGHILTVTKADKGTWIFSGANTYTGTTTIAAGTLQADRADVAATSGALGNGGTINFTGGTLQYTANSAGTNYAARIVNSTTAAIKLDTNGQNVTFGTALSSTNTAGLTKEGAGQLELKMGAGQYTGTTTINGGTLKFAGLADLDGIDSSSININNGASLVIYSDFNRTTLSNSKTFTFGSTGGGSIVYDKGNHLWQSSTGKFVTTGGTQNTISAANGGFINPQSANTVNFDVADGSDAVDLLVSVGIGSGNYTKSGAGTLSITSFSTLGGGGVSQPNLTINAGTFDVGGTARLTTSGQATGVVTSNILNNGVYRHSSSGAQTLSGIMSGTGALTLNGSGTLTISGTNSYTGATTVTTGTLQLDGSTHANSAVAIATAGTLTGSGTVNGNATLTGSGIINKASGTLAGTLGVTGGNWNGAGAVTGLVTSSSGVFNIGNGANLTANGGLDVTGGTIAAGNAASTITGNLNYTSASNSTFAGVIAGASKTLTLNNAAAKLILSGANTYSGVTNVTAGSLVINGSVGSTSVVVDGSLGGSGVMASATLSGSGSINPGNSPGIMTASATDPTGGLDYNFEFTSATAPTWSNATASGNDVLRLTSGTPFTADLTTANVLSVYFNVGSLSLGDVFTGGFYTDSSADFLSSISGATFDYYLANAGGSVSYNNVNYDLYSGPLSISFGTVQVASADFTGGTITNGYSTQFTVIPEPNVAALIGGFGVLLILRRRR